ncbi:unnamed protein product [Coffea canephora]|uniref:Uncharacterized protein n=2 Tax=Coffea TaxID=13442 RepID=A0A068UYD9_COFCA|nr:uncharacterized protein LOC113690813 [Coffea arabica]XP_027064688.1 uncharacterized protein LOC113690813 [Coffea arabica]CDP13560.1 unnamed protein product [Coffea canephora]
MAYILPNLSPTIIHSKEKSLHPSSPPLLLPPPPPRQASSLSVPTKQQLQHPRPHLLLHHPTTCATATAAVALASPQDNKQHEHDHRDDFFVNLGLAVRTLREDLPLLFTKDLNYGIYRDDITFVDPLNTFAGIEKYKLIFWALRFHGRILFREISLQVLRIWQPSENLILIRWNLRGVPRVPWEARGEFQATSRYKLDRNGKIYEHKVDNLAFNFPQPLKPAASVLDLVASCPTSPNPTFLWGPADVHSSSWVEFYRAVKETLDRETSLISQDCLIPCS